FPTKVLNVGTGNYVTYTYYGQGGVMQTSADRNGATTRYAYSSSTGADPYWRALSVTNPLGAVTDITYPTGSKPANAHRWIDGGLNSGNSIVGQTTTVDSLGRIVDYQVPQSPLGNNYDTIST